MRARGSDKNLEGYKTRRKLGDGEKDSSGGCYVAHCDDGADADHWSVGHSGTTLSFIAEDRSPDWGGKKRVFIQARSQSRLRLVEVSSPRPVGRAPGVLSPMSHRVLRRLEG